MLAKQDIWEERDSEKDQSNLKEKKPRIKRINLLQLKLETRKSRKGVRGMPWLSEAKKDVTSCDKPRGGANGRRSAGFRMGQPSRQEACYHEVGRTRGTETSKYPEEKKTTVIPRVAASESGEAQTGRVQARPGLKDGEIGKHMPGEPLWKTWP